jgi:hypothetical protein
LESIELGTLRLKAVSTNWEQLSSLFCIS